MAEKTNNRDDAALADPCGHAVRQLWDYLDGRLPDHDREWVAAHLRTCADCTSHYTFERGFLDALRTSKPEDPAVDALRGRVLEAIRRGTRRD